MTDPIKSSTIFPSIKTCDMMSPVVLPTNSSKSYLLLLIPKIYYPYMARKQSSADTSEVQFLNFGLHSEILLSAKFAGCQMWAGGKNRASLSDKFTRTVSKWFSKLFLSEISPTLPFKMAASTQSVHIC